MTPAQIAGILPGLELHGEGSGARVVRARPDKTGTRLILRVEDGGAEHDWEVAVQRLIDRAGGSADETRLRAALVTLYAEQMAAEPGENAADSADDHEESQAGHHYADHGHHPDEHGDTVYQGEAPDTIYGGSAPDTKYGGSAPDTKYGGSAPDTKYGGSAPDTKYGGSAPDTVYGDRGPESSNYRGGGSVSPGPGDPNLDL